jgi:pyruvate dehydrogenase E2 component (dihydrolipoamide acetyltransferase)
MHNIDISNLQGTGPNGRIVKEDVLKLVNDPVSENDKGSVIELSKMRKKIAERMLFSKQNIPHFYLFAEIDITETLLHRGKHNKGSDTKISVNDLIIKAAGDTLSEFPKLNSHVMDNGIKQLSDVNIGIAVSVDDGLLVPVISKVNKKSLFELSVMSSKAITDAQKGVIVGTSTPSFTISNLGMYEISKFIPIINPPECAIMGIGKVDKKVIPIGENSYGVWDTFGVRDMLTVCLACDHRGIDGVYAAEFLESFKNRLENIKISEKH